MNAVATCANHAAHVIAPLACLACGPEVVLEEQRGADREVYIHALCEDYRAGATTDLAHDNADRDAGRMIDCPMLAIWGDAGIPSETSGPLATWRRWASNVEGRAINSGHFLAEENPGETAKALLEFFAS